VGEVGPDKGDPNEFMSRVLDYCSQHSSPSLAWSFHPGTTPWPIVDQDSDGPPRGTIMTRICRQCRRANPDEAAFCYYDGVAFEARAGGPLDLGTRPFQMPFVFPSGRSCANFNELAWACRQDPAAALRVLRAGHLEAFLAGQGRSDLARAARHAARAADRERGLDELLGHLPDSSLKPARLRVEPASLDLGSMRPGESHRVELVLCNEGHRLLCGSASCDGVPWLALGDGAVVRRKIFQCFDRVVLPVRVIGPSLHAYAKPQEAEIRLESNGGVQTVRVCVRVPAQPFPEGVLSGALSPRQLAAKAHLAPKEAAPLIENGAVARWYRTNGWDYPITGPTATGLAAVQQLFEALGLVKAPTVELSEDAVVLSGQPGEAVEYIIAVVSQENRAAVAHGSSDQPWLRVGPTVFRGRSAFLPLNVPSVPGHLGKTLNACVTITANGNRRFAVPVVLVVGTRPPVAEMLPASPPAPPPAKTVPAPIPDTTYQAAGIGYANFLPAGLLLLLLLAAVLRDYLAPTAVPAGPPEEVLDPVPRIDLRLHDARIDDDLQRLWLTQAEPTRRFGLVMLHHGNEVGAGAQLKRLTFDPWGRTNNTCLRLDKSDERLFGGTRGRWQEAETRNWKDDEGREHDGVRSVWVCDDKNIEVTQFVERVRGEQSRLLDTCRVRYRIHNRDSHERRVGIRFLLDTYIGGNDGVPFTIPGDSVLCDTFKDLPTQSSDQKIPDFLQALEKPDLAHPGTVAHLRLKLEGLEPPARVTLGAWPNEKLRVLVRSHADGPATTWDVPLLPIKSLGLDDSAVVIYWQEKPLAPGQTREVGFEYGLWGLIGESGRLAVTTDGAFRHGGELTVVAYVNAGGPERGDETVLLTLPPGFALLEGNELQRIPLLAKGTRSNNRPVTWKVRAGQIGKYTLTVETGSGASQTVPVEIRSSIFD
jgi:hypothetical protein